MTLAELITLLPDLTKERLILMLQTLDEMFPFPDPEKEPHVFLVWTKPNQATGLFRTRPYVSVELTHPSGELREEPIWRIHPYYGMNSYEAPYMEVLALLQRDHILSQDLQPTRWC